MNLDEKLEQQTLTPRRAFTDSVLSMFVPFYNIHLINRADRNLGRNKKAIRYFGNTLLALSEVLLLYGLYGMVDGEISHIDAALMFLGGLGRTKGIAWGTLMECDRKNYTKD